MAPASLIAELSKRISDNTAIVDDYLNANNLPQPSFAADGPPALQIPPSETRVLAAQDAVVADSQRLHNLMKGPTEMLMGIALINPIDVLGLQTIQSLQLAEAVPADAPASYADLSAASRVNEVDLRRLMRQAMSNHIFQEKDGLVEHTAASRVLADNNLINKVIGMLTNELFPSASRTLDAIRKYDGSHAPSQSGFSLANHTDKGLYDELRLHSARGKRFAGAMSGFASRAPVDPIAQGFAWDSVKTVVDVGGGWGPVSIGLAKWFPHLSFIVQDLADVVVDGPQHVPADLQQQIQFQAKDMFDGQNEHGADVYLLRHVLHNFPDEYCVKILQAQLPALKKDSHIIVFDAVIPVPRNELAPYKEKFRRSMDLTMMAFFGARERTLENWKAIVKTVDERLVVDYKPAAVGQPPCNLLDIHW